MNQSVTNLEIYTKIYSDPIYVKVQTNVQLIYNVPKLKNPSKKGNRKF